MQEMITFIIIFSALIYSLLKIKKLGKKLPNECNDCDGCDGCSIKELIK